MNMIKYRFWGALAASVVVAGSAAPLTAREPHRGSGGHERAEQRDRDKDDSPYSNETVRREREYRDRERAREQRHEREEDRRDYERAGHDQSDADSDDDDGDSCDCYSSDDSDD